MIKKLGLYVLILGSMLFIAYGASSGNDNLGGLMGVLYLEPKSLLAFNINNKIPYILFNIMWMYLLIEICVEGVKGAKRYGYYLLHRVGIRQYFRFIHSLILKKLIPSSVFLVIVMCGVSVIMGNVNLSCLVSLGFTLVKGITVVYIGALIHAIGVTLYDNLLFMLGTVMMLVAIILDSYFFTRFTLMSLSLQVNVSFLALDLLLLCVVDHKLKNHVRRRINL